MFDLFGWRMFLNVFGVVVFFVIYMNTVRSLLKNRTSVLLYGGIALLLMIIVGLFFLAGEASLQRNTTATRADEGSSELPPFTVWLEQSQDNEWEVYATGESRSARYIAYFVRLANDSTQIADASRMGFRDILFDRETDQGLQGQDLTDLSVVSDGPHKGMYVGVARMSYNPEGVVIGNDRKIKLFSVLGEKPLLEEVFFTK